MGYSAEDDPSYRLSPDAAERRLAIQVNQAEPVRRAAAALETANSAIVDLEHRLSRHPFDVAAVTAALTRAGRELIG